MIHRILGWALSFAKRWVDDTVAEVELHTFLRKRLRDLIALHEPADSPARDPHLIRVFHATERLRALGLAGLPQIRALPALDAWMDRSDSESSDPVLHKGSIAKDVVDSFLAASRDEGLTSAGQKVQMERLLRHIEVHRQGALQFDKILTEDERWDAIHHVSLLCTLFARQEGDYRFLNAALKLNDWSYRHHRKKEYGVPLLGYLEALLEAEIALMEMTS
jgi:hypothetical protein